VGRQHSSPDVTRQARKLRRLELQKNERFFVGEGLVIMHSRKALIPFAMLAVLGCANQGSEGVAHPAKVHNLKSGKGAFVTTYDSRGRGAYIVVDTAGGLGNSSEKKSILLCAEPPPDASGNVDYSDALAVSVEASAAYELIKAAADVGVERDVSASAEIADVAARSELVLLMRDALYRLCEFHLNGTMTAEQISNNYSDLLRMAKQMGQRDNVSSLVHVLELSLKADAPEGVMEDILITIQALSFVEAAEASQDLALRRLLTAAAAQTLLTAPEVDNIKAMLREALEKDLAEQKKKLQDAEAAETRASASEKEKAKNAVTKAKAEVEEAQKELDEFNEHNPK
jgi:hypothetical protein